MKRAIAQQNNTDDPDPFRLFSVPKRKEAQISEEEGIRRVEERWRDKPNCGTVMVWLAGALFLLKFTDRIGL